MQIADGADESSAICNVSKRAEDIILRRQTAPDFRRNVDTLKQSALVAAARINEAALSAPERHLANRRTGALRDPGLNGAILVERSPSQHWRP
jgi:hypothetical protein